MSEQATMAVGQRWNHRTKRRLHVVIYSVNGDGCEVKYNGQGLSFPRKVESVRKHYFHVGRVNI